MKILTSFFSLFLLLTLPVDGAQARTSPSLNSAVEFLQNWRVETAERQDLEDREQDLRLQFITRLLFQFEQKYRGENLRDLLQSSLTEMILTDRMSINQSLGGTDLFLENLKSSLKELLEPPENPLYFIQAFCEFSGISDPSSMEEFAETRSYYDGKRTLAANPLDIEEAADFVPLTDPLPPLEDIQILDPLHSDFF